ncbi:MAG: MFS transporter [Methanobacterium sp.]|nr:MFS transporter [Methanobacterium sp.]
MVKKGRNRVLLVLFMGVLMGALDIAIVGPALPAIQNYFGLDTRSLSWTYTIYVLFFMVATPFMAKLSDRKGRRLIYLLDVLLFGFGSVITAFSPSFDILLIGRAIQGFGAGGLFPVASAFIGDAFPPEKRGRALGIIGAVFGISYLIGPILGGLLISYGWQWLFIINLPFSILVIILGIYYLPKTTKTGFNYFDWKGMFLLGVSLASLTYGINQINTENFLSSLLSLRVWPALILFLILLIIFWMIEGKAKDPIIRTEVFKNREITMTSLISVFSGLNETGLVFVPAFAIIALGFNNSQASLMLLPIVITIAIGAPIIGRVLDKVGSKLLMITGGFSLAMGLFILGIFGNQFFFFIISGIFIGLGIATLLGAPVRYIMINEFPESERASGQGLININTSIGQLVGGALIGAIISSMGGNMSAYGFAYIVLGCSAIILTLMALGLKGRADELKKMN